MKPRPFLRIVRVVSANPIDAAREEIKKRVDFDVFVKARNPIWRAARQLVQSQVVQDNRKED